MARTREYTHIYVYARPKMYCTDLLYWI